MTPEQKAKQHDLEETPRDTARRLLRRDVQRVEDAYGSLNRRLHLHARYLTAEDKREVVGFLEGTFEQTRTLIDGINGPREFGFSSELLDQLGD